MRRFVGIVILMGLVATVSMVGAQPPGGRPGEGGGGGGGDVSSFITRMMTLDANQDGSLSKDEVTDKRLLSLFERADVNKDSVVTKDELTALYSKEGASSGRGQGGGPGGPGGRGGFGPGGPGGPGGMMGGPPPIGQVLPQQIQTMLKLTNAQKKKLETLQKHVNNKLEEILTEEQRQQLEDMKNRGPGGPGGFGGPGGPGGPPPGGPGGPGGPPPN